MMFLISTMINEANMKISKTTLLTKTAFIFTTLITLSACGGSGGSSNDQENEIIVQERTIEEIFTEGSPWATTGVFLVVGGEADTSTNFINDEVISAGTVSSAQYRDGMFAFISLSDSTTGSFNETSLVQSFDDVVNNNASPIGFSFGDFAVIRDGEGNSIRRIRNASFAPTAVIDRTVTVANVDEFGYIFTLEGQTYFVEHKPYAAAFPDAAYPEDLQTGVDTLFDARFTEERRVDLVLRNTSPLATTGIFLEVNGEIDRSTNFITDSDISAGTISSAQYRDGHFIFVGLRDFTTGEFDLPPLVTSLTTEGSQPEGFSFGDFEIFSDEQGNTIRRLTNASFAPTAIIDRNVTTATEDLFTYSFERDGSTFFVEHKPYSEAFPTATFPEELQTAIDQFFNAL